jgi:signal recognition particle subunit SRP54
MFENLKERLDKTLKNLRGLSRLTEENIAQSLREVRIALLDADVALPVVKQFIELIREQAVGQDVQQSISPGQALVKIVQQQLIQVLGGETYDLNIQTQPPAVILMAGLQGSGKTTSTAKLARWIKDHKQKKVLVVSTDIYRPAAIEQLKTIASEVGVDFCLSNANESPTLIVQNALLQARQQHYDILLIDTAGRLHIDAAMMSEIQAIHAQAEPIETFFVVDSMTGQDAANTAKAFGEAIPLTGVILTKTDGDARGGAALSVKQVTGKPIKFIGFGEKMDAFEVFHPDRIASRILGMGDILSLIEEAERKIDKQKSEQLAKKFKKGKPFDLEDFGTQLQQMQNMGGMSSLLAKIPGMGNIPAAAKSQINDKSFAKLMAIINSMTPKERRFPDLINGSRKRRIALGSGTQIQDVNRLLKQFEQMQKMMKKMAKGGMHKMLGKMKHMLPPGGNLPF